ncbi:MAG: TlpA family protein disulfide reductase [Hydrogenothermaceae bacterium]|nr:TlpA family protein disulfide reductase [Hydrogenothermaceae bacterium]
MKFIYWMLLILFSISHGSELTEKKFADFYGKDESGKVVKLSEIAGKGKPVVVVFWAIGDVDTYKILPKINSLYDKYKNRVLFVAPLLSKSDEREVKEAKKLIPLKVPVWLAGTDAIKGYNINKVDVPYVVFIDKDGNILSVMKTTRDEKDIEKSILDLLK